MSDDTRFLLIISTIALVPMSASAVLAYAGISVWWAFFSLGCILSLLAGIVTLIRTG